MTSIATPETQRVSELIRMCGHPEIAASEIAAEFVIIPRSELPEVADEGEWLLMDGSSYTAEASIADRRGYALKQLALVQALEAREAREAEAAAAESKRDQRRDELAQEITAHAGQKYSDLTCFTQRAIDLVIASEQKIEQHETGFVV